MEQDMSLDSHHLRQLREARAWSQEQLAEISGLSTRTIQRLETNGSASVESRKALAAAFGIDPAELLPKPAAPAPAQPAPRPTGFNREGLIFLCVSGGLLLLDWTQDQRISWSKWPILGWGGALLLRYLLRKRPARSHRADESV